MFLKRKYTDGFYFAKSKTIPLKEIHTQKTRGVELGSAAINKNSPREPLTDTIVTNSGKRIACKVKTIERKKITYTNNVVGPTGEDYCIANRKVRRIEFNGTQSEYFTQPHPNGNPLIQKGLVDSGDRKNGMALFGSVFTLLLGVIFLVATPAIGFFITAFSIGTLVAVSSAPTSSGTYKAFNGIGKFLGIMYITTFIISILALIMVAAAL